MTFKWHDAEELAVEAMRLLGFADAKRTNSGADGGIDVESSEAVAQVKHWKGTTVGRPDVQRLKGAALDRLPIAFSTSKFTRQAVAWAQDANVALFEFDDDAAVYWPKTRLAIELCERAYDSPYPHCTKRWQDDIHQIVRSLQEQYERRRQDFNRRLEDENRKKREEAEVKRIKRLRDDGVKFVIARDFCTAHPSKYIPGGPPPERPTEDGCLRTIVSLRPEAHPAEEDHEWDVWTEHRPYYVAHILKYLADGSWWDRTFGQIRIKHWVVAGADRVVLHRFTTTSTQDAQLPLVAAALDPTRDDVWLVEEWLTVNYKRSGLGPHLFEIPY